jgi:hypothetical protein
MVPLLMCALLVTGAGRAEAWAPPPNPDPTEILHEAEEDARAGRHETALAKHLWFHRNALRYESALSGVRLSFALASWAELAEKYPPAMAALKAERDTALAGFRRTSADGFDAFFDFAGINRVLSEEERTVTAFKVVDAENTERAQGVFDIAMPALIKAREYELAGKYIEPAEEWESVLSLYRLNVGFSRDERRQPSFDDFAKKSFTNGTATLLGLLVVTGRAREAMRIAEEAREQLQDADFHAAIDEALRGVVPEPWP